jgi:uncharacterized cupredoxin-like copper-binding protein
MHIKRLALGAIVIATALSGCGGGGGKKTVKPASGGGAGTTIKETEYALAPGTINVTKAGTATFTADNAGKMVHALEIEGNGVEKKTGDIQPGSSAKLTVNLKPGSYEVYCPIDGHKQLGMKATLTVRG